MPGVDDRDGDEEDAGDAASAKPGAAVEDDTEAAVGDAASAGLIGGPVPSKEGPRTTPSSDTEPGAASSSVTTVGERGSRRRRMSTGSVGITRPTVGWAVFVVDVEAEPDAEFDAEFDVEPNENEPEREPVEDESGEGETSALEGDGGARGESPGDREEDEGGADEGASVALDAAVTSPRDNDEPCGARRLCVLPMPMP